MKKRLVVCSDGTWNSPEKRHNGTISITNVLKMARSIVPHDKEEGIHQVTYYDAGVGAESIGPIEKKLRGATGWGIRKNLADCYRFIAQNYNAEDELYLFGFSRGAYTVRLLSGLLSSIGILSKKDLDHLPLIIEYQRASQKKRNTEEFADIPQLQKDAVRPDINFLGVWDTVGALGIPTPLLGHLTRRWVGFSDVHLCEKVQKAYQALAIDERRPPFKAALWDQKESHQEVEQVWFAGVHSDIGGGYEDSTLADITLEWMAGKAMESGLKIDQATLTSLMEGGTTERKALGVRHNSMNKLYELMKRGHEQLSRLKKEEYQSRPVGECLSCGEMIHEKVLDRLLQMPDYRPDNLLKPGMDPATLLKKGQHHDSLEVNGVEVPIYRERKQASTPVKGKAPLEFADTPPQPCTLVD